MLSNDSSADEQIHKWRACTSCGHPQHSKRCREMTMVGPPGDVDECGCIELTSVVDIVELCRRSGGCPKHPLPEPAGEPECEHPDECPDRGLCGRTCGFADQIKGIRVLPRPKPERLEAPRPRPPYAVAYATGSGALNEIALPGDATVAVVDGTLVISHAAGVLGIAHVKPYEPEN